MPRGTASLEINASCEVVFDVLHDYDKRLLWDTLLDQAHLIGTATADKGVRSLCVGNWRSGFMPMETEYISFQRGQVAAVRLTNRPLLFQRFAASIRHTALPNGGSRITYTYSFTSRPSSLSRILDPIIARRLQRETRQRLEALRRFVERRAEVDSPR